MCNTEACLHNSDWGMFIHQTGYRGSGNTVLAAKATPPPPTLHGHLHTTPFNPHLQLFLTIRDETRRILDSCVVRMITTYANEFCPYFIMRLYCLFWCSVATFLRTVNRLKRAAESGITNGLTYLTYITIPSSILRNYTINFKQIPTCFDAYYIVIRGVMLEHWGTAEATQFTGCSPVF
jgi:hypothetical protein